MSSAFFVHITDLHLDREKAWDALETFVSQVNSMDPAPEFVINTGDTIFGDMQLTKDPEEARREFKRYLGAISRIGVPVYHAIGNHDVVRSDGAPGKPEYTKEMYLDLIGPRYYSFDSLGFHFIVVDTWIHTKEKDSPEDAPFTMDGIDDEQARWISEDIWKCRTGQRVCFLSHRRMGFYPRVWERIRPLLRDDLSYVNLAGCDHRNIHCEDDIFTTLVTGAFCGGWWNGPCVDTSPPGYAIIVPDDDGTMRHYYRPTDAPLAVATPRWCQVVRDSVQVDVIDPETGLCQTFSTDVSDREPGWTNIEIESGDRTQRITLFKAPDVDAHEALPGKGTLEFEVLEKGTAGLTVECNGRVLAKYEDDDVPDGKTVVEIPDGLLRQWNAVSMTGDAVIRLPAIAFGGKRHRDIRDVKLESVKPDWFREHRPPWWDISGGRPQTSILFSGSEFFFHLEGR